VFLAICSLRGPILAPEARRRSLAEGGLSLQIVASGGIGHAAPDILQRNPKAAVLCPQCGRGNLSLYLHGPKEAPVEKTTACQACGAYEVFVCAWWDYDAQRQEAIHAWVRRLAEGHPD
jgi:hypothetical protein